jgi:hypothetical protein
MNILYTITWPGTHSEELPRQFFDQLRQGVARGVSFPFDCPYEIALVRATETPDATPPAHDWAVAVLAMRVTTHEIGATDNTLPALENWFKECAAPGEIPQGSVVESAEASHLKLESELRTDYVLVESFGTFVGEPEPEPEGSPPTSARPPLSPESEALKALVEHPVIAQEAPKPPTSPTTPTPPPPYVPPALSNDTEKLGTCLGILLMAGGVLLVPVSVLLGALMALGQFSPNTEPGSAAANSIAEFIMLLACCPLPILILGVGLILLGVFLPRWIKQNQSRPAPPA